ncbi:DUF3617 family protein [uncultured Massilia sp.]|uniref:DUF3617 domain-containing protein n=1 Tax=uncultured Massilia sp. TaxID=169973 RepID=UPI0025F1AE15|nr:DUF3617 family protein [uncultured Massilia sp.]
MTNKLPTLAFLLAGACALPASAQEIRPGLWELSSQFTSPDAKVQSAMSSMQQRLANLPPEQRAQLEQTLRQNGVQLDIGGGGQLRTKICMTKEMAARKEFPVQQGDCTQKYTPQAGGKGQVAFSCTKPRISGNGEITMIDDKNYRANMRVTNAEQGSQVVDTNVTGRWLSADCGGLKPMTAPAG